VNDAANGTIDPETAPSEKEESGTPEESSGSSAGEIPSEEAVGPEAPAEGTSQADDTPEGQDGETVEEPEAAEEPAQAASGEEGPEVPKRAALQAILPFVRTLLPPFLFWWAGILVCELVIHTASFETMSRFPTVVLFSAAAAALTAALTAFPALGGKVLFWLVPPAIYLIYAVQLVYHYVFNAFVSLIYVSAGGDAIAEFTDIVIDAIIHCLPGLLIMAAPVIAFYVLRHLGRLGKPGNGIRGPLTLLASAAAVFALSVLALPLAGKGVSAPYTAFHSPSATVDRWTEHFGLLTAEALDLKRLVIGSPSGPTAGGLDLTAGSGASRNVLPGMDFDTLNTLTDREEYRALNDYFASLAGTGKNAYTGMFQGYNLIEICAESFSPYVIDPELTPTLYRLSHEGIVFENFYNSFPSVTSDGEYSLCMGMMINLKRVSFASSMDNYVPYCLGNMFSSIGVPARAYHNNLATFYNRINTHTNMGYEFKAINFGLDMEKGHPASDLEMFQKTVDEYIGEEQFHTYYMTYSGHAPYNFTDNQICRQNEALVRDIDASEEVRAYYCGELELERALTYLVERLEEEGIADRTVIVLTGDHYPYGLPDDAFQELAGSAVEEDPFWRYRSAFICWTGGLEEPILVDNYCCTQDILPTLLNLFGFSYDSRMLTGRDALADCTHAALLKDGSILTKEFIYNAASGEIDWQREEPDTEHAEALIAAVENQFTVASDVLDFDYYQFAFSALDLSEGRVERPAYTSYSDTAGTYYEQAAEYMARYGIVTATNDGCLQGAKILTRDQFATMAARCLRLSGDADALPYTDMAEGFQWAVRPLTGLLEAGLLPEGETQFRPLDPATQEESIQFMTDVARYVGHPDPHTWAESTVEEALGKQRASGVDAPENVLTRGSASYILASLIQYTEEASLPLSGS